MSHEAVLVFECDYIMNVAIVFAYNMFYNII